MNLNYSDEQQMLRDQIEKFCESDYSFEKREAIIKSENGYDLRFMENVFRTWVAFCTV